MVAKALESVQDTLIFVYIFYIADCQGRRSCGWTKSMRFFSKDCFSRVEGPESEKNWAIMGFGIPSPFTQPYAHKTLNIHLHSMSLLHAAQKNILGNHLQN